MVGVPRPLPDMAWLHQELTRPGVTLQRLWLEYLDAYPDAYRYSQFCRHYERGSALWPPRCVRCIAPARRPSSTSPANGVTQPCRYDPDVNETYAELAQHYGFAVIPARKKAPKDKAKVEAGVLLVTRWIVAVLRHRRFFSIEELNAAIRELLDRLNFKPFQKMPGSRRSMFSAARQAVGAAAADVALCVCRGHQGTRQHRLPRRRR